MTATATAESHAGLTGYDSGDIIYQGDDQCPGNYTLRH